MLTATLLPPPARPLIDLTVHDADLMHFDDAAVSTIHVWYNHEAPALMKRDNEELEQINACGHDFLNYMRNVRGRSYESIEVYWYDRTRLPSERDKDVEEYLEWRVNEFGK